MSMRLDNNLCMIVVMGVEVCLPMGSSGCLPRHTQNREFLGFDPHTYMSMKNVLYMISVMDVVACPPLRINVNFHYADPQYICIYSHLKCGNPHCSTIHPHCSTLHPPSKCGDVVDPHCIHILRVKVHIASTSQTTWTLSSTSYY